MTYDQECKNIILQTLSVNESRGQRKYLRVKSNNRSKSTFNFRLFNEFVTGSIVDISSAGMACIFDEDVVIQKNTLIHKMQLKLNGRLILTDGIVFGHRKESNNEILYIIMFTNSISEDSKLKIHKYIYEILQDNLEQEIKEIYGKLKATISS